MDHVHSVVRWACGLTLFSLGALAILIASFFLSPRQIDPLLHFVCRVVVWIAGIELRVHGAEKLDPQRTYLFVFNHISTFDHFVIGAALSHCIRGVEKEEHFGWPIYGHVLKRIGNIPIPPRGQTHRAIEALAIAKRMMAEGISIAIAPEGTRSADGQLQTFKKGAFHLAIDTQATIVPLVLVGAYEFNRKGDWHIYPGPIDLYIEDPVPTEGENVELLRDRIRAVIAARIGGHHTQFRGQHT